jgi:hypothetical protein
MLALSRAANPLQLGGRLHGSCRKVVGDLGQVFIGRSAPGQGRAVMLRPTASALSGRTGSAGVLTVRGHEPCRGIHHHSLLSGVGREARIQGCGSRVNGFLRGAREQPLALR